jgi:hypothetical protein
VFARFSTQAWATGQRIALRVVAGATTGASCVQTSYTRRGQTLDAYATGCSGFPGDAIFSIALRNTRHTAVPFALTNFVLSARGGQTFHPAVGTQVQTNNPSIFLPRTGVIPPNGHLLASVLFGVGTKPPVAASLSYVDARQKMTVVFDGRPG